MIKVSVYKRKSDGKIMLYLNEYKSSDSLAIGEKVIGNLTSNQKNMLNNFRLYLHKYTNDNHKDSFIPLEKHNGDYNKLDYGLEIYTTTNDCKVCNQLVPKIGNYILYLDQLINIDDFNESIRLEYIDMVTEYSAYMDYIV